MAVGNVSHGGSPGSSVEGVERCHIDLTGLTEQDAMNAPPTTIRTPYQRRVELVKETLLTSAALDDDSAGKLAVQVLHALDTIPREDPLARSHGGARIGALTASGAWEMCLSSSDVVFEDRPPATGRGPILLSSVRSGRATARLAKVSRNQACRRGTVGTPP